MPNEMMRVERALPVNGIDDLKWLGSQIMSSGMFGCKNPSESIAIACMCQQTGMSWMKWMETYHLIKGKISKKASAIVADFQRMGGKMIVVQHDYEGAVADFEFQGSKCRSSCLWKDVVNEPFIYIGHEDEVVAKILNHVDLSKDMKPKYATPRSRMQMLWARCVSDGVRTVCPAACEGVYTPEETEDIIDSDQGRFIQRDTPNYSTSVQKNAKAETKAITAPSKQPKSEVIDVTPSDNHVQIPAATKEQPKEVHAGNESKDPNVCRIPGQFLGKLWKDLPKECLKFALSSVQPEIRNNVDDETVKVIKSILGEGK